MKKFVVALGIFLMAVYYFISPQRVPKEGFFVAVKEISAAEDANISKVAGPFIPIKINNKLAYLGHEFILSNLVSTNERLSFSNSYYAVYNGDSEGFTVFSATGEEIVNIQSQGVPFIFGERIFSVDHVAGLIKNYDTNGEVLWSYNVGSYVTSLHANKELTVFGGLNGYVTLLNEKGEMLYEYRPSGSASEIIYGAAVSPDSQYFAVISGLDPQRFLLFRKGTRTYTPVYHRDLKQQFVQPVRIKFSDQSNLVLYEEPGFLNGYHIGKHQAFSLPIDGKLKDFTTDIFKRNFGFLVEKNDRYTLQVLNHEYLFPLMQLDLHAQDIILNVLPTSVVFGINETLLELEYKRQKK